MINTEDKQSNQPRLDKKITIKVDSVKIDKLDKDKGCTVCGVDGAGY